MSQEAKDVSLRELVAAMSKSRDGDTFRWFQDSVIDDRGVPQATTTYRVSMGQVRQELAQPNASDNDLLAIWLLTSAYDSVVRDDAIVPTGFNGPLTFSNFVRIVAALGQRAVSGPWPDLEGEVRRIAKLLVGYHE